MPLRFFRRIRIAPGISVNLSKSGASVSVGPRGAKVTVGPKGIRRTVGLPGTGVYYTTSTRLARRSAHVGAAEDAPAIAGPPPPAATGGFWARRSRKAKAAIIIAVLLVIAALSPHNNPATSPASSTTAISTPAATSHAVLVTPAPPTASPRGFVGDPATAPPTPKPKPTPTPTAKPKPKPTPKPTPRPPATALTIRVTQLSSPVSAGSYATLAVRTLAGARCSIVVEYKSGPSSAAGLTTKTATSAGAVSWQWKVGTRTTAGVWPIYVTCSKGGQSHELGTQFRVR